MLFRRRKKGRGRRPTPLLSRAGLVFLIAVDLVEVGVDDIVVAGRVVDALLVDEGVGFTEAPRGALAHWVRIKDTKIENYQCVVPTTWNGSPRDEAGNIGAFEAALLNTKVERPNEPVEILRSIHSFDPCLACSTHVMSEDGEELAQVTTTPVGS